MKDDVFQKTEYTLWAGMLLLSVIACLQGMAAFQAPSIALLAAAAQSVAGVCVVAVVIMSVRTQRQQATSKAFQRNANRIAIVSMLLAVLIMVIGTQMGILSVKSLVAHVDQDAGIYPLILLLISIAAKELLFQYLNRLGNRFGAKEFISNARRHRSDIYSSFVAIVGMLLTLLSEVWDYTKLAYIEPVAALLIAIMICYMGFSIVRNILSALSENVRHQEDVAEFIEVVGRILGVISVDDLSAREQGHYVVVEMSISVNPRLSVWEGHEVSKKIKAQLMKQYQHISNVVIHVNPYDPGYPYKHHADNDAAELPSVLH
ncbi:hypothetical protein A8709_12620 [Paenibacillus pectinilyticus]|uniref:Uncharacterized protein n=1 Tax=Paenibacillus pectinilyticus TaxID=512399 RepID=A0A1C1A334_9BACL|nr:cation diffusion facilitator family transporter [Paenibacillus pectinilyticus]OCT14967.1 hypothetical protein A8709_12620 [Paenibacillus pectinilyticus]